MININIPLTSGIHPEDGHLCAKHGMVSTVFNQQKRKSDILKW
jgi:hypothetical protein